MRKTKENEFWVSNLSDRNVSLRDLGLTIRSRSNVNLLDSRHYSLKKEQLELSAASGSLFAKSKILKVRQVAPEILIKSGVSLSSMPRFIAQNTCRTGIIVEEQKFEELSILESDEKMADEMTDD
jgi:hypothetical protein